MQASLSADVEVARRIAFTFAKMANKLSLPAGTSPDWLIQAAMERPEAVTPDEFKLAYTFRTRAQEGATHAVP
jgi:hypothetical protein